MSLSTYQSALRHTLQGFFRTYTREAGFQVKNQSARFTLSALSRHEGVENHTIYTLSLIISSDQKIHHLN